MSNLLHPRGPEPPVVYWVRRLAVIAVAITLILALVWLVQAVRGRHSASPTATSSASAGASGGASASGSAAPNPSSTTSDGTAAQCPDSVIKVDASTNAATYPVGSTPKLTLAITNTGTSACSRDVGPAANALEVTSGGYHVWSSADCSPSSKSKVLTLDPGQKVVASITWDGKLSAKGCPDGAGGGPDAKPGRYAVTGSNGTVASAPTPFALTKG